MTRLELKEVHIGEWNLTLFDMPCTPTILNNFNSVLVTEHKMICTCR